VLAPSADGSFGELLISRARKIVWLCLAAGLVFTALEVALNPWPPPRQFYVKCVGVGVTIAALMLLELRWGPRGARRLSIALVALAYVMTAVSGMMSPSREYATTAVLFTTASLATATLLPWGLGAQLVTVTVGGILLLVAVLWSDGNLWVASSDPAMAVVMGLGLSVVAARELQRYRVGMARELEAREHAEMEVRALSIDLERRVATRTAELRDANEQLRSLSARLQSVREEERTRIAREVHDELGQMLTALKMDIDLLPKRLADTHDAPVHQVVRERLTAMSEMAATMIQSVRRISAELRPSLLDDLGLSAALEWQAREFERRLGVRCHLTDESRGVVLDSACSTALFRIVQEALTNVARHASASRVEISLGPVRGGVRLRIADDGRGIHDAEVLDPRSLGLLGIRERARLLGGEVEIHAGANGGTFVEVWIPSQPGVDAQP
jgi:signal transduction histidine kinase